MARIQPCLRKLGVNLGYYNGKKIWPRNVIGRENALLLNDFHFCLIWKSEKVSSNQAIKELKDIFKIVDNFVTEENVISHFKYDFKPKKIESHLTNFITYDLETLKTDRARPYVVCFYRLSKLAGKNNRDLTPYELNKCENDIIPFRGDNCVTNALDFCLKLKKKKEKVQKTKLLKTIFDFMLTMEVVLILG